MLRQKRQTHLTLASLMHGDEHPTRVDLRQTRERTIERLSQAFAEDELGLDEFEQRLDLAHQSRTTPQLQALVSDLSAQEMSVTRAALVAPTAAALALGRTAQARTLAILGSVEHRGLLS